MEQQGKSPKPKFLTEEWHDKWDKFWVVASVFCWLVMPLPEHWLVALMCMLGVSFALWLFRYLFTLKELWEYYRSDQKK